MTSACRPGRIGEGRRPRARRAGRFVEDPQKGLVGGRIGRRPPTWRLGRPVRGECLVTRGPVPRNRLAPANATPSPLSFHTFGMTNFWMKVINEINMNVK